jgi:hypothetical protein
MILDIVKNALGNNKIKSLKTYTNIWRRAALEAV